MSSFENTLERMKNLYTYGKELNESSKSNAYTLEHSAVAADGKTYGIVRECNKFYIKSAQKGKETIAESYEYIGGFCNKKNYEYTSYNNALKNFELKMASINEACEGNINISTLDPFKKGDFIVEGTDKMKNEIARQRQIMFNVSMLMNEGSDIGASRKDDVVMNRNNNPEAETGKKGDECVTDKKGDAKPDYAGSKTNGVDKKVAPFKENAPKCADQLKENCDCDCGSDSCDCKNDWGTKGIGKGRDPKTVGWDIEKQQAVNEEESDWGSEGLPSTPGVGEADTDHNNEPFNNAINEEDDMDFEAEDDFDVEDEMGDEEDFDFDTEDDDIDFGGDEFGGEDEFDAELDDDDFGTEDDMDAELDSEVDADDDIMAQIDELQAQIDALRAKLEGGDDMSAEDDMDAEAELDDDDFSTEDFGTEDDMDAEFDDEDDMGAEAELDAELDSEDDMDAEFNDEDDFDTEDEFDAEEDSIMESKRRQMDKIVESVVNAILNEDELHAFGKHPGYQKKPMELPSTGEDKNQWGEDWNDDSVYSEEPFGTKIGDSTPFVDKLVDAVSKDVMKKLAEAANGGKKKVK
jgi:segregation and condensation protein B